MLLAVFWCTYHKVVDAEFKKESHTSVTTFGGRHVKKNTPIRPPRKIYLSELKLTVVTGGTWLTNMAFQIKPVSLSNITADDGRWAAGLFLWWCWMSTTTESRTHMHPPDCLHVFTLSFVLLFNLLRNIQHLLLLFGEASCPEQHQHAAFADTGLLIKAAGS